jgi:L-ascorbate metabolism protein UlaG (beta-lactamase superfamily)
MTKLRDELTTAQVEPGSVRTWWLGGNGFVFKTPAGTQVFLDPYLSDIVGAIFGLERAFPPPITAEDARPDIVVSTHWHEDHLDPGALPVMAKNSDSLFVGPPSAVSRLLGWGVPRNRVQSLESGQVIEFRDLKLKGVPARHVTGMPGWETPDAIGVILDFDGLRVYHSGDTEYDLRLRALADQNIHVTMTVINGTGGNMNAHEAALLVWQLGARIVIPMHHILIKGGWPGATLDPEVFGSN